MQGIQQHTPDVMSKKSCKVLDTLVLFDKAQNSTIDKSWAPSNYNITISYGNPIRAMLMAHLDLLRVWMPRRGGGGYETGVYYMTAFL
jgi:hypothetical protein